MVDDAALVRAVQGGDVGAYAVLYERHRPAVRRLCARWLHDDAAVDDVVQAAFVRAFEHIDRCTGESRFAGWVQVIAQRLCIDTSRAAQRARVRSARAIPLALLAPEDPADTVVRHEQVDALQGAIATLPPRQRQVAFARLVEGRRPAEIAATLGMTTAAVDSLLLRARRKLLTAYGAFADESGGVTLPAASFVAATAAVSSQPEPLLRVAAAVGGFLSAPVSSLASATSGAAKGARALAVAVAAAIGGGLVAAPATSSAPASRPAIEVRLPVGSPAASPAPAAPDPLDPVRLTIDVPPAPASPLPLAPNPTGSAVPTSVPSPAAAPVGPVDPSGSIKPPPAVPAIPSPGGLPLVPDPSSAAGAVVGTASGALAGPLTAAGGVAATLERRSSPV